MPKNQALVQMQEELHTSFSQIQNYLGCSLRYRFQYLEGLPPEKLSISLFLGSAIHASLALYYKALMEENREPLSVLEDMFQNCLALELETQEVPVIFNKTTPNLDSALNLGKSMLRAFFESADLENTRVVAVEQPLSAWLYTETGQHTDIKLIGVIDLLLMTEEGELISVDHKTAKNPYSLGKISQDLQMSAYSYLLAANKYVFPTAPVRCAFQVLRKLKSPKVEIYETVRTADQRRQFAKIANAVLHGIDNHVFIPSHGSWLCAECSYSEACKAW